MSQLKPFIFVIQGLYCSVPHRRRKIELLIDEKPDNVITETEQLIILHDTFLFLKKMWRDDMNPEDFKKFTVEAEQAFIDFHDSSKTSTQLKYVRIYLTGQLAGQRNPDSQIRMNPSPGLTKLEMFVLLFEMLCMTRNKMAKTHSREQLADIAEQYNIRGLGMARTEDPFVSRE